MKLRETLRILNANFKDYLDKDVRLICIFIGRNNKFKIRHGEIGLVIDNDWEAGKIK